MIHPCHVQSCLELFRGVEGESQPGADAVLEGVVFERGNGGGHLGRVCKHGAGPPAIEGEAILRLGPQQGAVPVSASFDSPQDAATVRRAQLAKRRISFGRPQTGRERQGRPPGDRHVGARVELVDLVGEISAEVLAVEEVSIPYVLAFAWRVGVVSRVVGDDRSESHGGPAACAGDVPGDKLAVRQRFDPVVQVSGSHPEREAVPPLALERRIEIKDPCVVQLGFVGRGVADPVEAGGPAHERRAIPQLEPAVAEVEVGLESDLVLVPRCGESHELDGRGLLFGVLGRQEVHEVHTVLPARFRAESEHGESSPSLDLADPVGGCGGFGDRLTGRGCCREKGHRGKRENSNVYGTASHPRIV